MLANEPLELLLKNHTAFNSTEQTHLNNLLSFVQNAEDFQTTNNKDGHITSSAWILDSSKQKTLLVHHKKLNKWVQPGGHIELQDKTIFEAALREAREETGLENLQIPVSKIFDVDIHQIPFRKGIKDHLHYDIRILLIAKNETFKVSDESNDIKWINLSDLDSYTNEESILRMKAKTNATIRLR
jgi:8-oxo-dGTP pyrophosphatase MutT (NUDIX family)